MLRAKFLEIALERGTHRDNPFRHAFDFRKPLLAQIWIIEDLRSDTSSIDGWIGVEWSDEYFYLTVNSLFLLGRLTNNRESTNTFSVETLDKILGRHAKTDQ